MLLLLTDHLTCPRCGPDFGLILQADQLVDRDVIEGRLGCANCRDSYPIEAGVADLRHPMIPGIEQGTGNREEGTEDGSGEGSESDRDRALRTAALLGVTAPRSLLLVIGAEGEAAAGVAAALPDVHVLAGWGERPLVAAAPGAQLSALLLAQRLPFRSRSLHGAAMIDVDPRPLLPEVARVLTPGGRLVLEGASDGVADALRRAGFTVHLEQDRVVVAVPPTPG